MPACRICSKCEVYLAGIDTTTAVLWVKLLEEVCKTNRLVVQIKLENKIEQYLNILENERFISTRDTDESLDVLVKSFYTDENGITVLCNSEHEHAKA